MKLNLVKFKDFVKKATLNNSIETIKITVDNKTIKSGMMGDGCITIVNIDNDIITGVKGENELYFNNPFQNLIKYLDLMDDEECDITIKDEKIILKAGKQKTNAFFCAPALVNAFTKEGPKDIGDQVVSFKLKEDHVDIFNKIKKVASSFGKVYFTVEDGVFSIEATDKTNKFTNSVKFDIGKCKFEDVELCFNFKNFNNLLTVINGEAENFTLTIKYIKGQGGLLSMENGAGESYFLVSAKEDTM